MKQKTYILIFLLAISFSTSAQKIRGEKKTNKELKEMTVNLNLTKEQQKKLKPLIFDEVIYKKDVKKEKKARKKNKIKLTKKEKKVLKAEKKKRKRNYLKALSGILSAEQLYKYKQIEQQKKEKEKLKKESKKKN